MKYYKLKFNNSNSEVLKVKNKDYLKLFKKDLLFANKLTNYWKPTSVSIRKRGFKSHLNNILSVPILNQDAVKVIYDLIKEEVELLPLIYKGKEQYFVLNVINVLDCIDKEKSEPKKYSDGTIYSYLNFTLKEDRIKDSHIFKAYLEDVNRCTFYEIFVSSEFKRIVEKNKLTGFSFEKVNLSNINVVDKKDLSFGKLLVLEEETLDFYNAMDIVINKNKQVISGKWSVKLDSRKNIIIGELKEDGRIEWFNSKYYPPYFFKLKWNVVKSN